VRFCFSSDFVIDSDEEPWCREGLRVCMLGGPGSGKSWNNALFAEQFLTQGGTVVIFQPRDEYYTLKEKFDVLSVGGVHAKDMEFALTAPKIYAKAVVEDGVSMIFYTSGLIEEKLVGWVARFIHHLMALQEVHKRPLLIIVEEAHEYAPRSASGHVAPPWVFNRMIKALKDCFTQGRKLNINAVASSQRPQELNFTIRQLANLSFYGKFAAQDISYIDKECLKYVRKQVEEPLEASRLLSLKSGEWLVIAGAHAQYVTVSWKRITKHGAETPSLEYVAPRATKTKKSVDELGKAVAEALKREEAEKSELEKAKRKIRELSKKLEAAEEQARIKLSVKDLLEGNGTLSAADLEKRLAEARRQGYNKAEKTLREMETKLGQVMKRNDELAQEGEQLQPLKPLRDALANLLPASNIPKGNGSSITLAEIDERINQRVLGLEGVRVVSVDVSKRIKELVKNDYVSHLVSKIQGLPEPAKKAALWLHEKRQAKIGDLYFYMYEKAGRIPGNFYANVMKPLENAWLIVNESGNVRWTLQEKLAEELKEVLRDGDVQEIAEYLKSLLLGGGKEW
jgi:phage shock protein A